MRKFYFPFLLFSALAFLPGSQTAACGYDWVGECSSAIHLRINGTLDSFTIAECPFGLKFQGQHLGTLQSLSLANARAITWESCFNNVSAVQLKYRVYEQGIAGGAFQALSLDEYYSTLVGPYTTRYRDKPGNISLSNGLTSGKTYVVEAYFIAEVDTIGDDFIPETTIIKNNNGLNYRATFTYGGPTASPFVVVPTKIRQPSCHGSSDGAVGVSVWGDHTGIFYFWSNTNLNFYEQNNIPAGTYIVTVSGVNYSESDTIVLHQPDPLTAEASNIQPVGCGGGNGSATVLPTGGTPPYKYLWENGLTTASATFPNSGQHHVTITDAHQCTFHVAIDLPASGLVQQSLTKPICPGGSVVVGGITFSAAGVYTLVLPANTGCDTLLTLTIEEQNLAAPLLANLPANILVSCANPGVNLCAETAPGASFQWAKDGLLATPTPCLLATAGGVYSVTVTLNGCSASKSIVSEEHLIDPVMSPGGVAEYLIKCYEVDSTFVTFSVNTAAIGPQFEWTADGQLISTAASFTLAFDGGLPLQLPEIWLKLTDQYGCSATKQPIFLITPPPFPPSISYAFKPNLCNGLTKVLFDIWGVNEPFSMSWNGIPVSGNNFSLPPGQYDILVVDADGCLLEYEAIVPVSFTAIVHDSNTQGWNSGSIEINEAGFANLDYLWDNGSTSSYRFNLGPGSYCVSITDQENNCTIDTCFTVGGISAAREESAAQLGLWPNPVAPGARLQVYLPSHFWNQEIWLEILNVQGKQVLSKPAVATAGSLWLEIPDAWPGSVFLLRVRNEMHSVGGKVLLQR